MRVTARDTIEKGQTLLVIPERDLLLSSRDETPKKLWNLYSKVAKRFRSVACKDEHLKQFVRLRDVWLAIRIMNIISEKDSFMKSGNDLCPAIDPLWLQGDTWPSEEELLESFLGYWDEKQIEGIWGYKGLETGDIGSMRQFLILSVLADEFQLKRNLTTGRLRGRLYEAHVLPLLCRIIDYNLGLLQGPKNATTSADAVKTVKTKTGWEATALLARVAYRETLLSWRHAFVQKAVGKLGRNSEDFFYETAHPRCLASGRGCKQPQRKPGNLKIWVSMIILA